MSIRKCWNCLNEPTCSRSEGVTWCAGWREGLSGTVVQMTVKEIVTKWLVDNGYDGLYGEECGCPIDHLFLCQSDMCLDCEPGYRVNCEECPRKGTDDCPDNGVEDLRGHFCIITEKPQGGAK